MSIVPPPSLQVFVIPIMSVIHGVFSMAMGYTHISAKVHVYVYKLTIAELNEFCFTLSLSLSPGDASVGARLHSDD